MRLSGTAELYVPSRDPNATVKVPGFLAQTDKPIASKGLKSAKVELSVFSRERYAEEWKKMRLDEKKIAAIRAEAKERGMKDEEIEVAVAMAKAFDEMGGSDAAGNTLFLQIPKESVERIHDLRLETPGGEQIETGGSSSRADAVSVLKQLDLRAELPKDAVLAVSLYTDKAMVSVPFDLKEIPLP